MDQAEHADFYVMSFPKFAAILSIDESTKLDIRNADNEWVKVDTPCGEMLVFRGDVLHHGSKYTSNNKRLYFKLLPDGAELEEVEKDSVSHRFVCPICQVGMEPQKFQNHKRYICGKSVEELNKQKDVNRKRSAKNRLAKLAKEKEVKKPKSK